MKVRELIAILENVPYDMEVITYDSQFEEFLPITDPPFIATVGIADNGGLDVWFAAETFPEDRYTVSYKALVIE